MLLADWAAEREPRGSHGIALSVATDPRNNPISTESTGRFVAEPVADFAQDAIDRAKKERRDRVGEGDDWPLLWRVRHEQFDEPPEA